MSADENLLPKPRADTKRARARLTTIAKIKEAAGEVFRTVGYERATIRDIARKAGMSTGAIFANWSGKAELYVDLYGHPPVSPEAGRDLMAALQASAATFRRYACLHEAKGTAEGREKAAVNRSDAERCEAAIAQAKAL